MREGGATSANRCEKRLCRKRYSGRGSRSDWNKEVGGYGSNMVVEIMGDLGLSIF